MASVKCPQAMIAPPIEHGAMGAEVAVGDEAAGDRQHVDGHRVVAVDARRIDRGEAEPAAGDRGDDEQRQQRAHAVVGEALPQLGEEQGRKPAADGPARPAWPRAAAGAAISVFAGLVDVIDDRASLRPGNCGAMPSIACSEFYRAQTI